MIKEIITLYGRKEQKWRDSCKWIKSLPYAELITGGAENNETICNKN